MRSVVLLALFASSAFSQIPSPPKWDTFRFTGEITSRQEARTGVTFGEDPEQVNPLIRTRLGAEWTPKPWIKLVGLAQDGRAPLYGGPTPGTARDTLDLQEGYVELFPNHKLGFGATIGRQMVTYGESRLIGAPQWINTTRTWDTARLHYNSPKAKLELVFLSVVKIQPDSFNKPVLGDRIWGTYNAFPGLIPEGLVEAYVLRHDQNRPGGFTGVGRLGTNTFGERALGPLPLGLRYSIETAVQGGHVGPLKHRAGAWYSRVSRKVKLRWPTNLSVEYKYASGTKDPQGNRSGTFDQFYPANHDKFGHVDLFGWRNIHNLRSHDTFELGKGLILNFMYDNLWLASPKDALYNGPGRPISQAAQGNAGTHIGHELDWFVTYKCDGFQFGAGFGHFFAGEFVRKTTPGVNPRFLYIFQSYSF